uniref:Uncharacterized protein n=1 Tax=Arundo donax TaxID=35708 RepID=A0A0A9C9M3_ARUDO
MPHYHIDALTQNSFPNKHY